jgi:hypothetical protein
VSNTYTKGFKQLGSDKSNFADTFTGRVYVMVHKLPPASIRPTRFKPEFGI